MAKKKSSKKLLNKSEISPVLVSDHPKASDKRRQGVKLEVYREKGVSLTAYPAAITTEGKFKLSTAKRTVPTSPEMRELFDDLSRTIDHRSAKV